MSKNKRSKISRFPVKKINTKISRKLVGLFIVVILALLALIVRITIINASQGSEYKRIVLQNTQQQYVNKTLPFKRGDITDRNGTILATSEKVYNVILDCEVVNYELTDDDGEKSQPYIEPTVKALVEQFSLDEDEIRKILTDDDTKNSRYQVIKKNITLEEKEAFEEAESIPKDSDLSKEEKQERLNINGVWFEETYLRVYPQNSIACDLIGFTNSPEDASWGIEGYYNDILKGENGRTFGYFNSDSDVEQNIIPAEDGNNVVSTADVNIQQIIRNAIQSFQAQHSGEPNNTNGAANIAVLVMDPNSGEVLGMDSSDWYDLNDPRDLTGIVDENVLANMTDDQKSEKLSEVWKNYCIADAFEPGSTVKPFTVSAALATGKIKTTDRFECDGYEYINSLMIRCSVYPDAHGELDTAGALINSCNDALMQIGTKLGVEDFLRYQGMFNFGTKTGIDLPGENAGIIYTADAMGPVELATSAFGQGFTCNMVQEAAAMCSLINGGYYYKPHVVKSITDSNGNQIQSMDKVVERQTVSSEISDFIRETLGQAARTGTAQEARVPGYSIGGKTGTAQKVPRDSGNYLVSFIGFAPVEDPQVLVYVVVDEPNAEKQDSSSFAQQIAKQVFTELLPYMNIFPDDLDEYNAAKEAAAQAALAAQEQGQQEQQEQTEAGDNEGEAQQGADDGGEIPEPPAEVPDDDVQNGGNGLYSDGIDNDGL